MSNNLPSYSDTDSNNSGLNVSIQGAVQRFSDIILTSPFRQNTNLGLSTHMNTPTAPGDSPDSRIFTDADASSLNPSDVGDHAPSSPSSGAEVTGATIEVITVEKYKRSDGFANPYHIQGLNASTPDDVDDEDEEEEEDPEGDGGACIDEVIENPTNEREVADNSNGNTSEEEVEENTLRKDPEDEPAASSAPLKELRSKHPSIPTSSDSTVSSESRLSNTSSSLVPTASTSVVAPRTDSTNSGVNQPQRLFQFTIERVPSTESTCEQTPTADQQPARITPPVSVSRAPTSESLFAPEVPSDAVSVDESFPNEAVGQAAPDIMPSGGTTPWMPHDFQPSRARATTDLPSHMVPWNSAEMAAAAAATAAVASAVVNPVVGGQTSQGMGLGQPSGPHFNLAVAAATAAVAAMKNMMIDQPNLPPQNVQPPDLSAFAQSSSLVGADLSYASAYRIGQSIEEAYHSMNAASAAPSEIAGFDRGSTPSPGPMMQSTAQTPPQLPPGQVDNKHPSSVGATDSADGKENDEGEIRFRRTRYLEKRERWHDKRFLVVDTFRREEPVTRPDVVLPEPTVPLNCSHCFPKRQPSQTSTRPCPCSGQEAPKLQQFIERYSFKDHKMDHGFLRNKNKHLMDNHFGRPETALMRHARQYLYSSRMASARPLSSSDISSAQAVGTAAAAAAVASMNTTNNRETGMKCSPQASGAIAPSITVRRNRLQRNNSHFHIARSSPSSFSANEFPQIDRLAALAAAAAVSVSAAVYKAGQTDVRDRAGMQSKRSSESEVNHPSNPPTSPASGPARECPPLSSRTSASSNSSKATLKVSVENLNSPVSISVKDTLSERHSSADRQQLPPSVTHTEARPLVNQSNAHMAGAPSSLPGGDQPPTPSSTSKNEQNQTRDSSAVPSSSSVEPVSDSAHVPVLGGPSSSQSAILSTQSQASQSQPLPEGQQQPQPQQQQSDQVASAAQASLPTQPSEQPGQPPRLQQQPNQSSQLQSQVATQSTHTPQQRHPNVSQPVQHTTSGIPPNAPTSSEPPSGAVSTVSVAHSASQPTASGTINPTETAVAAAYAACGLMMQGGYGNLPPGVHPGDNAPPIGRTASVSSNTSSMNYIDQYRMQHLLPVGPTGPSSSGQDPGRQSTEARIAQSLDNVRQVMLSYFRELEEKHNYQMQVLQEEIRQLREQRERDHALIREYVPAECLLQLGHPYSSLANISHQPARSAQAPPPVAPPPISSAPQPARSAQAPPSVAQAPTSAASQPGRSAQAPSVAQQPANAAPAPVQAVQAQAPPQPQANADPGSNAAAQAHLPPGNNSNQSMHSQQPPQSE